jgi:hypothetical protein
MLETVLRHAVEDSTNACAEFLDVRFLVVARCYNANQWKHDGRASREFAQSPFRPRQSQTRGPKYLVVESLVGRLNPESIACALVAGAVFIAVTSAMRHFAVFSVLRHPFVTKQLRIGDATKSAERLHLQ